MRSVRITGLFIAGSMTIIGFGLGCSAGPQGAGIDTSNRAQTPAAQKREKPADLTQPAQNQPQSVAVQNNASLEAQKQQTTITNQKTYPAYTEPPQSLVDDPSNITLYNYTQEGITSVNGESLALVVPPGKSMVLPKRMGDIDDYSQAYNLTITTDSGKSGQAQFDPYEVDEKGWTASVSLNKQTQRLEIKQNAGGGGGGGGNKALNNFFD
jgi:hypothetical protein